MDHVRVWESAGRFRSATGGGAVEELLRALAALRESITLFWCSLCGAAHQDNDHFDRSSGRQLRRGGRG